MFINIQCKLNGLVLTVSSSQAQLFTLEMRKQRSIARARSSQSEAQVLVQFGAPPPRSQVDSHENPYFCKLIVAYKENNQTLMPTDCTLILVQVCDPAPLTNRLN